MEEQIEQTIEHIETKIKSLENIGGFKKSIGEFNKVSKELDGCKTSLNKLSDELEALTQLNPSTEIISDEKYEEYMGIINSMNDTFDNLTIRKFIQV